MDKIKLVILDDHSLIIEAVKSIMQDSRNLQFIKGFTNYTDLKNYLINNQTPDILLLDIRLGDETDGISVCKELCETYPHINIIILSSITQPAIVTDALKKGAKGFLPKNINLEQLMEACVSILQGKTYLHKDISFISSKTNSQFDYIPKITRREKEVLKLIMEEFTSAEIAERLFISINTVENHRASLFSKTGAKNIVGLIKYTIEKGLLDSN